MLWINLNGIMPDLGDSYSMEQPMPDSSDSTLLISDSKECNGGSFATLRHFYPSQSAAADAALRAA